MLEDLEFTHRSSNFEYFALYTNHRAEKPEITRLSLGNYAESKEAKASYDALFKGDKPKATVGLYLNTRYSNFNEKPMTHMKARKFRMDCWEMLAEYLQKELKQFTIEASDEKEANVKTTAEFNDYLKEQNKKLRDLYSGEGGQLYKRHRFRVLAHHKKRLNFRYIYQGDH